MKILFSIFFFVVFSLQLFAGYQKVYTTNDYIAALKKVTDVMVDDVTSPVAASRYYSYITICAYETLSLFDRKNNPSLSGSINGYNKSEIPLALINTSESSLAVILSIFKVGEKLLPSGYLLKNEIERIKRSYSKNPKLTTVYTQTALLADTFVKHLLIYIKQDGFSSLNNQPRYTPKVGDDFWKPTPPVFMAPVEPHWNKLRTFILDSAQQYKVKAPSLFDTAKTSLFYSQLKEVYDISYTATKEQKDIAMFWDCNPFNVQQMGHVEFGIKKISPGGHWIGITGIACKAKRMPLRKTALIHALVGIALADAFIACWDEKYRSNRVRPETAIQKLINPNWHPLLQTPPFPEYVSGHSVASTAAGFVLTKIFGNSFVYNDNTEMEFGLPVRKYNSFRQAAAEASISRLYGGIHFRDAIEQGIWQGENVAQFIVSKLKAYFFVLAKSN